MNTLLKKKINVLIHLAKVDGHLDESEKELIYKLLQEAGETQELDWKENPGKELEDASDIKDKDRLIHWALQLIKVDGVLHADELAYCKALAIRLNYKPELIDLFATGQLPELTLFSKTASTYRIHS